MSTQENEKDLKKTVDLEREKTDKEIEQEKKENKKSGEGHGYVPPAPEIPSARNTREHGGPIIDREPGGLR
ncbi:hypothetical protein FAZ19_12795 [Sphingobacterium alkalisoli]|uniref:Uncharacterized protein n=1 Tax=Sphingobacterium alkalisoli TaxID=1874115 RepID=A0A4U0H6J9_9SPHI|nr:hypothetical protein [Sphingobacterium alkalisoli]TJY65972.1 hypothetical protein FAZ19_12795 [Sphingobacterium alkalisoli]GGH17101.1 hypothetical protein GCM10011418_19840 [Sphingobacterium alkalisoli]